VRCCPCIIECIAFVSTCNFYCKSLLYQNLNQNCNILYLQHLICGLYVCTCVFLLRQESFNMILVNNSSFYDGGVSVFISKGTTLVPCKSEDTSVRRGYGGEVVDSPVFVWGRFGLRVPTVIPACLMKMSPSKGTTSRDREWGGGLTSLSSPSSSSSSSSSPRGFTFRGDVFPPP
jgi:hypothetical protein